MLSKNITFNKSELCESNLITIFLNVITLFTSIIMFYTIMEHPKYISITNK